MCGSERDTKNDYEYTAYTFTSQDKRHVDSKTLMCCDMRMVP